jgi:hypothetical protein
MHFRRLELNGGTIQDKPHWHLVLPPNTNGYANAQIDDYGLVQDGRRAYPWHLGTTLRLRARFSHPAKRLQGTAGFGFWNAPFGDPTIRWPALPQAAWFFFASEPTDLPLAPSGPGRGWFAATLDASKRKALVLIPAVPAVLLLNQFVRFRRSIWPRLRSRLSISYSPIEFAIDEWHAYEMAWMPDGTVFSIDGTTILKTTNSPTGPLGFVCWIDNQYLVATISGRLRWGTLPITETQWLEVDDLSITRT